MSRVLAERALVPHPSTPCEWLECGGAKLTLLANGHLLIDYVMIGDVRRVRLPTRSSSPQRMDGLWQSTCFELFGSGPGSAYAEYNFSPSGDWAAYRFDSYRDGMRGRDLAPPLIDLQLSEARLAVHVILTDWAAHTTVGLAAVIEDDQGTKSYWALAHPPGKPDFHHRDCFALSLPAPTTP